MIEARCQMHHGSFRITCGQIATKRVYPRAPIYICENCLKVARTFPNFSEDLILKEEIDKQLKFDFIYECLPVHVDGSV